MHGTLSTDSATFADRRRRRLIALLWLAAALIVAIVAVGGITRLTESGVSITEWKPVSGVLPPLSAAQWQAEFDAYRQTPQFIRVNGPAGMTLATYKFIFFWEWVHRLIARVIGLLLLAIAAWGWLSGAAPVHLRPRLAGLVGLVALQGAVGWWMVRSGIEADIRVSHFRLATHLVLALTALSATVWTALDLDADRRGEPPARLTGFGAAMLGAVALQVALGALVAGLRAGYVAGAGWFNWGAWPLMQGRLVPAGIDTASGIGRALGYDPYLLHFLHRWWAWAVVIVLVEGARRLRACGQRAVSVALHSAFGTQILLGIATVWSGVALWIAVAHQTTGALVLVATVWAAHALGRGTRTGGSHRKIVATAL